MRIPFVILLALIIQGPLWAQQPGAVATRLLQQRSAYAAIAPTSLFKLEAAGPDRDALWNGACSKADVLKYDETAAHRLIAEAPERIRLEVPSSGGVVLLALERAPVLADGFTVRRASDGGDELPPPALHYRGIIEGVPVSIAAISIFDGEVMGLIADGEGQRVLGRFDEAPRGLHVLYRDGDLLRPPTFACGTPELPVLDDPGHPGITGADRSMRCVNWYWEAAYDIFQGKGSVSNVVNYLTGLFNQSATLFANDGVEVALQEVYVWDVPSPYNGSSSNARLYQFGSERTSFNGDMAHLLDYGSYGGVAWLNTLCSTTYYRKAYSGIKSSYSNVPTYSWSVNVVTHEQGHNMGSSHTHACVWNGNNTAIDGCGPAKGYVEGSCPDAGLPSGGGTIMSYCHLVSGVGINFTHGFGPQPKLVILDRVNAASCLVICSDDCDAPGLLSVAGTQATMAVLSWSNIGADSYDLRWKEQAAGTWNTVDGLIGNTHVLTDLQPGTAYEFQVLAHCATGTSDHSASRYFNTAEACTDTLEPNDTWQEAAAITLPATIAALIADPADEDFYTFTAADYYNVSITLAGMAGDYDLFLLDGNGVEFASSTNGGLVSEYLFRSVGPGTYTVRVAGHEGAFNAFQCYNLNVYGYPSPCPAPDGLGSSNITWQSAQLGWNAIPMAGSYGLRYRLAADTTFSWTMVADLPDNSHELWGLLPASTYVVQVQSQCQGGGSQGPGGIMNSEFSPDHLFTTLAAPCEADPPVRVAAKVLLEGPYAAAAGLMVDSLRRQGVLPLQEPYTAMGLAITGPGTTTAAVLAVTGNNAIVDWVLVELRDAATGAEVLERRAALLQRNGDVVALDGTGPVGFCVNPGEYRVAVRHRNHLGCMTAQAYALDAIATVIDLSSPQMATYGTDARKVLGGVRVLWAGNASGDNSLRYTGQGNDRDAILVEVGGGTPTETTAGYLNGDVNLDGTTKYAGPANDRDPILINIGGGLPTQVRQEQLP